jgi:hypothetical protein
LLPSCGSRKTPVSKPDRRRSSRCDPARRPAPSPGIADERRQPVREPLLELRLQRRVAGADAVLHPLDVAERGIRPRTGRTAIRRVRMTARWFRLRKAVQLGALVVHSYANIEDRSRPQFVLRPDVCTAGCTSALVGILCAAPYGLGDRAEVQKPGRIALISGTARPSDRGRAETLVCRSCR